MSNDQIQFDAAVDVIIQRFDEEPAGRAILYSILKFCTEYRTFEDIVAHFKKITENCVTLHNCGTYVSWLLNSKAIERENTLFKTTPEGAAALNAEVSANRLSILFERQPELRDYSVRILHACVEPQSREDLEALFDNVLESTGFYPSYFTSELENAGGLVWEGKWKTTDSGTALIKTMLLNEDIRIRRDV